MTAPPWQNRIIGHADVSPAELTPNPANWRSHPAAQQRALAGALAEIGWVDSVIVNRTTGNLVDGHLRIELALGQGAATVPVTYVELSEAEELLVLASFDPLGAMAEADPLPGYGPPMGRTARAVGRAGRPHRPDRYVRGPSPCAPARRADGVRDTRRPARR